MLLCSAMESINAATILMKTFAVRISIKELHQFKNKLASHTHTNRSSYTVTTNFNIIVSVENDLDGVVHVLNSASKVWSILCVPERDFFTTLEADDLCAKMGQERATNYTLIEVSRLLGEHSTWAVVNASVKSASTGAPYVTALTQVLPFLI